MCLLNLQTNLGGGLIISRQNFLLTKSPVFDKLARQHIASRPLTVAALAGFAIRHLRYVIVCIEDHYRQ